MSPTAQLTPAPPIQSHPVSSTETVDPSPQPRPNKHEQRTRETRALLLGAAETVFVRDGYEKADLAEIASLAGRTKGAIYAQFRSKEEIFIALVEAQALKRRAVMQDLLVQSSSIEGNLAAMRRTLLDAATDNVYGLLLLEFRLYTIRHPEVHERLAAMYRSILQPNEEAAYTSVLGSPPGGEHALKRSTAVHTAFALVYAMQVEMRFEPSLFDESSARTIAGRIFDALFDPPAIP